MGAIKSWRCPRRANLTKRKVKVDMRNMMTMRLASLVAIVCVCVCGGSGCGQPKDLTWEQYQSKIEQYSKVFQQLGGRGTLGVRAGRPSVGMIGTGFVFIPGIEIDAAMDLDATRVVPERIITTSPAKATDVDKAVNPEAHAPAVPHTDDDDGAGAVSLLDKTQPSSDGALRQRPGKALQARYAVVDGDPMMWHGRPLFPDDIRVVRP